MSRDEFIERLYQDGHDLCNSDIQYIYTLSESKFCEMVEAYFDKRIEYSKGEETMKTDKPLLNFDKVRELIEPIRNSGEPLTHNDHLDLLIDLNTFGKGRKNENQ